MNAGLDGDPPGRASTGTSVASYLERFDGRSASTSRTLVGNTPLRIAALGWDD